MKTIRVSAAIIINQEGLVFATERGYGDWKGYWEFPGGKREEGETGEETIVREIQEELASTIQVDAFLKTVEYDYPTFHLTMDTYICSILDGNLELREHEDARWMKPTELHTLNWLPADEALLEDLESFLRKNQKLVKTY
ncbi:MAG: 8-oxo-dGTP diphosphatase MutT [Spirochaetales bacterium]|nr:8-oxo-dGTP diphosphatase MutT [Candidatus Physcosoma equi]